VEPEKFISAFSQHLKRQGRTDLPKVFPDDPNGLMGMHGIFRYGLKQQKFGILASTVSNKKKKTN